MSKALDSHDETSFLLWVDSTMNANMICGLLAENGIPTQQMTKGAGGYMEILFGSASTGIDLYVPTAALAHAQQILAEVAKDYEAEVSSGDYVPQDTKQGGVKPSAKWLFGIAAVAVVVVLLAGKMPFLFGK